MQVLDLRSWTWSKVEVKAGTESLESPSTVPLPSCAGHSLVSIVFHLFSRFLETKLLTFVCHPCPEMHCANIENPLLVKSMFISLFFYRYNGKISFFQLLDTQKILLKQSKVQVNIILMSSYFIQDYVTFAEISFQ